VVKPSEEKFSHETDTLKEKERKIEKERERGIIEQSQAVEQQRSLPSLLIGSEKPMVAFVFIRFS